ncbi:MAG: 23S rRNA (adenine(2503)-C(2))-methyltransferase RlmN [Armatimonadetes bacterium]|nr:23S rRNA (adenine(2503)-C(2))-methyltransferase RlmN [Armatimonadota bacterium]
MKINLKSLTLKELEEFIFSLGEKKFKALQIFKWIFQKGISNFDEMTDLSKNLRESLKEKAYISELKLLNSITSKNQDTVKYSFLLEDQECIESVLMRYEEDLGIGRVSVCLSTQAGCARGCYFCASGKNGLARNLKFYEIADQVLKIQNLIKENEERAANLVFMGIGEPLDNYFEVIKVVKLLNEPNSLNIGSRHIAISTCGIPEKIIALARESIPVRLAISLHSADSEKRSFLMPVNKKYPLEKVLQACREYQQICKRRITFEYALIKDFNDAKEDADSLFKILRGIKSLINIIPFNPILDCKFKPSPLIKVKWFRDYLKNKGISATVRKSRGLDIDAACGQLRLKNVSQ